MAAEIRSARDLWQIIGYFLRLGLIGAGGPVALCGIMERDLIKQRGWASREEMHEAVAASQILPGPLAIQVCIFICFARAGQLGAWLGGIAFILPSVFIVTALAALYVDNQDIGWINAVMYGVSPAIVALVIHTSWRLHRLGMEDWFQWVIAGAAFVATVAMKAELELVFLIAAFAGMLRYGSLGRHLSSIGMLAAAVVPLRIPVTAVPVVPAGTYEKLIAFFLSAGTLAFGSGLVLLPALELGVVGESKWLSHREFLMTATIGLLSQGPVMVMATFVGFLVAGFWGAMVSTAAVFLPAFLLVVIAAPLLRRHRANPNLRGFLKGAFGASIGTIVGAAFVLGQSVIGDALTLGIGVAALGGLFWFEISHLLLITLAGIAGFAAYPILQPVWLLAP